MDNEVVGHFFNNWDYYLISAINFLGATSSLQTTKTNKININKTS